METTECLFAVKYRAVFNFNGVEKKREYKKDTDYTRTLEEAQYILRHNALLLASDERLASINSDIEMKITAYYAYISSEGSRFISYIEYDGIKITDNEH